MLSSVAGDSRSDNIREGDIGSMASSVMGLVEDVWALIGANGIRE